MERVDIVKITEHDFAVAAVVLDKKLNKEVRLVIVYGPAHDDNKEQFLIELSNICAQSDLPLLLGGDFNIIRYSGEKNRKFHANRFTDMFNWIINSYGLREVFMSGGNFTWSNNQTDPTLEKLECLIEC
jgi:hypothetical protein